MKVQCSPLASGLCISTRERESTSTSITKKRAIHASARPPASYPQFHTAPPWACQLLETASRTPACTVRETCVALLSRGGKTAFLRLHIFRPPFSCETCSVMTHWHQASPSQHCHECMKPVHFFHASARQTLSCALICVQLSQR